MKERAYESPAYFHVVAKYLEWITTPDTAERLLANREQAVLLHLKSTYHQRTEGTFHALTLLERHADTYGLTWDYSIIETVPEFLPPEGYDAYVAGGQYALLAHVNKLFGGRPSEVNEPVISYTDIDTCYYANHSRLRSHVSRPLDTPDFVLSRNLFRYLTQEVAGKMSRSSPYHDSIIETPFNEQDMTILNDVSTNRKEQFHIDPYSTASSTYVL